jgi:hypothetical protein
MTKNAGSGLRIQDPNLDPLVRSMDPRIRIHLKMSWIRNTASVPDPHVFGPSGSGSNSQRYGSGSGSFYHHAKNSKKNLDSYYFVTLFDFLSLKNNVNVPSKSTVNSRKNCVKN